MEYRRMPIEAESPEQLGYETIKYNLAESSVRDEMIPTGALTLNDLLLSYGDHLGKSELRQLIANETKSLAKEHVLITPSAATALFIIHTTLLEKNDHLIIIRPNYATNIETPKAIGCQIEYLDVHFEDNFKINWSHLESLINTNTKLISLTHPHNPTGACLTPTDFIKLEEIAKKNSLYILVDETYRELNRSGIMPYAADIHSKIISVSSMSKAFGIPGIRIGWILSQDKPLMERFLAAKEQIIICNSIVDEEIAYHFYANKTIHLTRIEKNTLVNFEIVKEWMKAQPYLQWVEPSGGVVCFPRIKEDLIIDYKKFYRDLNEIFGTFVGPGYWFDQPANCFRIGFGYPLKDELKIGLQNIIRAIDLQIR